MAVESCDVVGGDNNNTPCTKDKGHEGPHSWEVVPVTEEAPEKEEKKDD